MTWVYGHSTRELLGKRFEFRARASALDAGSSTDEHGRAYPDPSAQASWFREQVSAIECILRQRLFSGHRRPA